MGCELIVAKSPLTFTPQNGGIKLLPEHVDPEEHQMRERTESPGPINLFDSSPYEKSVPRKPSLTESSMDRETRGNVEDGIWAPKSEDEKFKFAWPSEEIRKACEEYFAKDDGNELPALNWIPVENARRDHGVKASDMELDIQH